MALSHVHSIGAMKIIVSGAAAVQAPDQLQFASPLVCGRRTCSDGLMHVEPLLVGGSHIRAAAGT